MKDAILELARAVNRLADALEDIKEGKEETFPHTPYKKKSKKTTTTTTRACARFQKPTVEEFGAPETTFRRLMKKVENILAADG